MGAEVGEVTWLVTELRSVVELVSEQVKRVVGDLMVIESNNELSEKTREVF